MVAPSSSRGDGQRVIQIKVQVQATPVVCAESECVHAENVPDRIASFKSHAALAVVPSDRERLYTRGITALVTAVDG